MLRTVPALLTTLLLAAPLQAQMAVPEGGFGHMPALHQAAFAGDLGEITRLLDAGDDPDALAPYEPGGTPEYTAFRMALGGSHPEAALLLSERGADVTTGVPLISASGQGFVDVVRALLERGVDPDQRWRDRTALGMLALVTVSPRAAETGRLLIEAGADPNAEQPYGSTPLLAAARSGAADYVAVLLEHGAAPTPDPYGNTPLDFARENGHRATVLALGGEVPSITPSSQALLDAIAAGSLQSARDAVAAGASLQGPPPMEGQRFGLEPPLVLAIEAEQPEIVALLIEAGSDLGPYDEFGTTPAHDAALHGSLESTRLLIEAGAPFDVVGRGGTYPVLQALTYRHAEVALLLLEQFGHEDWYTQSGYQAPLHLAARYGLVDVVRWLVEHGADPEEPDGEGRTPLAYAAESLDYNVHLRGGVFEEIEALLRPAGASE